jgi:hypothetical protein
MSNESQILTQMTIFSHIDHILHNHFATFCCGLGFLKFLTFLLWSLRKYEASFVILTLVSLYTERETHSLLLLKGDTPQ